MFEIKEYRKFLLVTGIREFRITNYDKICEELLKDNQQVEVQLLDAQKILDSKHIYFSTLNALKAFKKKKNISKNLAMEILLYTSGQRQIKFAIDNFGLKKGKMGVVLIGIGNKKDELEKLLRKIKELFDIEVDDSLIEALSKKKIELIKSVFDISDIEIETIKREGETLKKILRKLIIERMALLYAGIR